MTEKGNGMGVLRKLPLGAAAGTLALLGSVGGALADTPAPTLNSGDTAWMLTSSALVLMMTIPGLALFYGGMVRKKNVVAIVAQNFAPGNAGAVFYTDIAIPVIGLALLYLQRRGGRPAR